MVILCVVNDGNTGGSGSTGASGCDAARKLALCVVGVSGTRIALRCDNNVRCGCD